MPIGASTSRAGNRRTANKKAGRKARPFLFLAVSSALRGLPLERQRHDAFAGLFDEALKLGGHLNVAGQRAPIWVGHVVAGSGQGCPEVNASRVLRKLDLKRFAVGVGQ